MTFKETPRLPEALSAGSKIGPGYSTSVARNLGGFEASNQNWSMPLYEGDIGYVARTQQQLDDLLAFFHGVAGRHHGFRVKNFYDYLVTGPQGTVLQLSAHPWQMQKTYTYGALNMTRKISKPVAGVAVAGGGTYSVDTTTGIITAIGSPAVAPTGWTGQFDTPMKFNTDKMLPLWIAIERYEWQSIPIIEIRL